MSDSFNTPWTVAGPALLCLLDFPGKSTGVGCHFLLQGIFQPREASPTLAGRIFTTEPPGKPPRLRKVLQWCGCCWTVEHTLSINKGAWYKSGPAIHITGKSEASSAGESRSSNNARFLPCASAFCVWILLKEGYLLWLRKIVTWSPNLISSDFDPLSISIPVSGLKEETDWIYQVYQYQLPMVTLMLCNNHDHSGMT